MWTRWRLFSYIDCFHLWTVFTCRQFSVVDVDFSHMGCFQLLTVFTCGLHINSLQTLTTNWLFTQVASMLTVYSSGQHIDSLHKWTACWQFTQVDSIATICTSGQHIEFERVDSMFTVFWSLTLWTVFRSPWTQANCWGLSLIDIVDCVQITMWDLNTGKLLRTIADAHPPGTAVLHVKVRLATSLSKKQSFCCVSFISEFKPLLIDCLWVKSMLGYNLLCVMNLQS